MIIGIATKAGGMEINVIRSRIIVGYFPRVFTFEDLHHMKMIDARLGNSL